MIAIPEDSEFHPKNAKKKFEFRLDRDWFQKEKKSDSKKEIDEMTVALLSCPDNPSDFDESMWLIITDEEIEEGKIENSLEAWARSAYVATMGDEIWVYVPIEAILEPDEMTKFTETFSAKIKGHYATFISEDDNIYIETTVLKACFPKYRDLLAKVFIGFARAALVEWVEQHLDEEEDEDDFPFSD